MVRGVEKWRTAEVRLRQSTDFYGMVKSKNGIVEKFYVMPGSSRHPPSILSALKCVARRIPAQGRDDKT